MTKKEVIADLTRLVEVSESFDEAGYLIEDYMHAVSEFNRLGSIIEKRERGVSTIAASKDDDGDFEFGGAHDGFGGGGAKGEW